jgi:hypothetical protein
MAVSLEGGSNATSVYIHDDTDAVGSTPVFTMNTAAAISSFRDFTEIGGIPFTTGCWVVTTGTGAICYVWTG